MSAPGFGQSCAASFSRRSRPPSQETGSRCTSRSMSSRGWVAVPGTKRVMLLAFMTVFAELEEVMVGFFDAIVRVIAWDEVAHPTP